MSLNLLFTVCFYSTGNIITRVSLLFLFQLFVICASLDLTIIAHGLMLVLENTTIDIFLGFY